MRARDGWARRTSELVALILQRESEMTLSCTRQRIRTSKRCADKLQVVSRLSLAIGFILLLFGTARSDAADSCLDNLPTPTPLLHRVVQLVNCSNQRVLGTANAAHVVGSPPTPVLPREKTWVMEPFPVPSGAPANANVLTIDIPKDWEDTSPKGSTGPNFWVRTGCRYDVATGLAQCETGGCSGFYDCSAALLGPPAGATLAEWTFYQATTSGATTYYSGSPGYQCGERGEPELGHSAGRRLACGSNKLKRPAMVGRELPAHGAWSRPANTRRRVGSVQRGVPTQTLRPHRCYDASHSARSSVVRVRHLGRYRRAPRPRWRRDGGLFLELRDDMSFRQPRPPTAAIRTPIPVASCTKHSACTCRRTRTCTARRAKPTRIAITMGSITGSRVGTTETGSPCAAAGASSNTRPVIQASAPFSMATLEARLGSLRTLNAPTSATIAVSA